jgi:GMP synthase-like glutamine amidotransferase
MKIGILETGEVAEALRDVHGDYPAMFRALLSAADESLAFMPVHVVRGEMPESPFDAEGWIVTGSRHGVYDGLPWIEPLKDFLRACYAARVPVVGVCFGHQILAEALGGRVEKSAKGWGLGVHRYRIGDPPSWMGGKREMAARAVHQDQIVVKPPGATVLASSDFCEFAALAYGDPEAPLAISVQPHPEFSADYVGDIARMRRGNVVPADVADAALATLDQPTDDRVWAGWMVDFLKAASARRKAA